MCLEIVECIAHQFGMHQSSQCHSHKVHYLEQNTAQNVNVTAIRCNQQPPNNCQKIHPKKDTVSRKKCTGSFDALHQQQQRTHTQINTDQMCRCFWSTETPANPFGRNDGRWQMMIMMVVVLLLLL